MTDSLLRVGLVPDGALGPSVDGVRQRVRDADGVAWVVTVVPPEAAGAALERVARLRRVAHPHVATPERCLPLADGSLAVLQPEVVGTDLATLRGSRGAWPPGEVVTVVVPLADALAALHDAGLAHGDVAPGNVVLRPDGRPVLIDVVLGAEPGECGTPLTAAPERVDGAAPAADVHALARLGLVLLGGATEGSDGVGLAALTHVLRAACDADPAVRPTAARLAEAAYAACPPTPVRLPDAAVLARLSLRRLARADDAPETLRRRRPDEGGGRPRGRHRRRVRPATVAVRATAALVGVALVGAGALAVVTDGAAGRQRHGAAGAAGAGGPVAAAVQLTQSRAAALASGHPAALVPLTVPGSPAARADRRGAAAAAAAHHLPEPGAALTVVAAGRVAGPWCAGALSASWPVARPGCRPEQRVRVVTDSGVPGAARVRDVVVLVLTPWAGQWRVSEVTAAP